MMNAVLLLMIINGDHSFSCSHDIKDAESEFFKCRLRSQYAKTIRETKKNAKPEDFDRMVALNLIDGSEMDH